ncbi:MAG: AI-2E family transporter [Hyphomicrobiaceae bacterium]
MPMLTDSVRQLSAAMIVAALTITMLILGQTVLIPLAGAIIASFILAPVVRWLTTWGLPRGLAVTGVVALILFLLLSAATLLSVELLSITSRMSDYRENLVAKVRTVSSIGREDGILKRAADTVDRLSETVSQEISKGSPDASKDGSAGVPVIVNPVKNADGKSRLDSLERFSEPAARIALLILFTVFLLLQHQDMRDRVVRIAGIDNLSETTSAMSEAGKRLSRLFLAQAVMSASYGLVIGIVLWLLGLPGSIVWGVLAGVMRFVPFIGSYIAAVPPVILAAGVDPGWWFAILIAAIFLISEIVMGNVIEPLVLGRRVGLSPFAMIAAASFWTLIWGAVGLLLAAPLTMAVVVLGRYIQGLSFVSVLLGDEPALEPQQELYHRLLSSDVLAAADQIETSVEETSLAQTTDRLILPALALAARDARAGRLTDLQAETLGTTLAEASELQPDLTLSPNRDEEAAPVVVVAARGNVDIMATRFLARVIEAEKFETTRAITPSTGLTALSLGAMSDVEARPVSVVIASVAGLPRRQLQLMAARAARSFPDSRIVVLSLNSEAEQSAPGANATPNDPDLDVRHLSTVGELLGNLKLDRTKPSSSQSEPERASRVDESDLEHRAGL